MLNNRSPLTIYCKAFQTLLTNRSALFRYFGIFALIILPGAFLQSLVIQFSLFQSVADLITGSSILTLIQNGDSVSQIVSEINVEPLSNVLEGISLPLLVGFFILFPILALLFSALLFLSKWTAAAHLATQDSLSMRDCLPRLKPVGKFALAHLLQMLIGLVLIFPLLLVGVLLTLLNPWLLLFMPLLTLVMGIFFFIMFWIWLILSAPAIFVDGKGPVDALKNSYRLARGAELPLFLTALLFLLTFIGVQIVTSPLNFLSSIEPMTSSIISAAVFLVKTGVSLASYTAITQWYVTLREEDKAKEQN